MENDPKKKNENKTEFKNADEAYSHVVGHKNMEDNIGALTYLKDSITKSIADNRKLTEQVNTLTSRLSKAQDELAKVMTATPINKEEKEDKPDPEPDIDDLFDKVKEEMD